jgi:toxin ParE1/3/4
VTVRWTPTALRDLESLYDYVADDSVTAAAGIVEHVLDAIGALERHPSMGRRGRVAETRELIVNPYIVAYRLHESVIELLGIIHGARRWPDSF